MELSEIASADVEVSSSPTLRFFDSCSFLALRAATFLVPMISSEVDLGSLDAVELEIGL